MDILLHIFVFVGIFVAAGFLVIAGIFLYHAVGLPLTALFLRVGLPILLMGGSFMGIFALAGWGMGFLMGTVKIISIIGGVTGTGLGIYLFATGRIEPVNIIQ